MADFPFQIVGFDLDGTLVDSNRDLTPAVNHALRLAGRPEIPADATRKLIGGGARRMLERAFELTGGMPVGAEFEALHGAMLKHYEAHIADHTIPYPGCVEALDALLDRGCRLAVLTNKIEIFSRKLLDALDLSDRFELILGGDTLGPGRAKPAPDMIDTARLMLGGGRFAMVGDSTYDVRAARNADVPVVALSFGYNDMPAAELGAHAVIDHYHELIGTLERI